MRRAICSSCDRRRCSRSPSIPGACRSAIRRRLRRTWEQWWAAESPGGVLLAFRSSFRPSLRQLAWVDRAGNVTEKIGEAFASGSVGVPGDGTRFLMCLSTQEPVDAPITVILNWKPKQ